MSRDMTPLCGGSGVHSRASVCVRCRVRRYDVDATDRKQRHKASNEGGVTSARGDWPTTGTSGEPSAAEVNDEVTHRQDQIWIDHGRGDPVPVRRHRSAGRPGEAAEEEAI